MKRPLAADIGAALERAEYWLYRANDYFMQSLLDDPALLAWIFC